MEITFPLDRPLAVSNGLGVNSLAMLVGMAQRGIRPDLILNANVGSEKDPTYAYIPTLQEWLAKVGFPDLTVVRYAPSKFKNWPPYYSLFENCITNATLPSISFGFSSCSQKWKAAPQHRYIKQLPLAQQTWLAGKKIIKAIGYDCTMRDKQRQAKAERLIVTYKDKLAAFYDYWFPLQEWGWDRAECMRQIKAVGLPVPPKSSCIFCVAMQPEEVADLPAHQLRQIVLMEARAKSRLKTVEGLWRKGTKKRPGSMTQFIAEHGLLPADEIERIQQVPSEIVRFQQAFRKGDTSLELGDFLREHFPEIYNSTPIGVLMTTKAHKESTQESLFPILQEAA
jgi:hypothetical protein